MRPLLIISLSIIMSVLMVVVSIYSTRTTGIDLDGVDVSVRKQIESVHMMQADSKSAVVDATQSVAHALKEVSKKRNEPQRLKVEDVLDVDAIREMQKLQRFMVPVQYIDNGALTTVVPAKGRDAIRANGGVPKFPVASVKSVLYALYDTKTAAESKRPVVAVSDAMKPKDDQTAATEDPAAFNDIEVGIFTKTSSLSGGDGG